MINTEKFVVKELKTGSEQAFEVLYNKYHIRLYHFAFGYLKDKDDAENLVQEVFIKIWTTRFQIEVDKSFSSFLFTIAKNKILDIYKKRTNELNYKKYLKNCFDLLEERTKNDIIFSDLENQLTEVINTLPKKRRIIYKLSRYKGLSNKEIAQRLGISEKTVENQMTYALSIIKKKFQFISS